MTVSNVTNSVTYTGNGAATGFPFEFEIPTGTIVVTVLEIATLLETELSPSEYSVTGLDDPNGGEVLYPLVGSPLASTHKITIKRVLEIEQTLDLTDQSAYNPTALEAQLDRYAWILGQINEKLGRALIIPSGASADSDDLLQLILSASSDTAANVALASAAQAAAELAATNAAASAAVAAAAAGSLTAATVAEMFTGTDTAKYINSAVLAAQFKQGADNTGGATITLGDGAYFNLITSTTAITSFAFTNDRVGRMAWVRFNTVRTLTYNATSLIIPGSASITTAVGDKALIMSLGSGNFLVLEYVRFDGRSLLTFTSSRPGLVPASGGGTTTFLRADGTFAAASGILDTQTFTANGTWNKPSNGSFALIRAWGGGASGGKGGGPNPGGGGGGGSYSDLILPLSLLPSSVAVTVGASVAGVSSAGSDGNDGNSSSFGSWLTAPGGSKGLGTAASGAGGDGGQSFRSTFDGGNGGSNGVGQASSMGGGGGGGAANGTSAQAGGTSLGAGAGGQGLPAGGSAGTAPAGGGGGCFNAGTSGAGARGQVEVLVF